MPSLEDAIVLAAQAHRGQKGRDGEPYIMHPLRMTARFHLDDERTVAMLHDVVEKTDTTLDDLRRDSYSAKVVAAVDALTEREGESYEDLVARAAADPLARAVKIADLEDHLDLRHAGEIGEKDRERLERQRRAWKKLMEE